MALQDTPVSRRLSTVKRIIIVLSGKGGVGKSSVSTQLAINLYASSPTAKVGILDVDLTGPSIPRMLGLDGRGVHQSSDGWVPVYADGSEARLAWTSDEHLSLLEHMAPVHDRLSAVIVTTPQAVALMDAMKCLSFTRAVNLPVVGLIENMSGYVCPCCGEVSNVFSTGGGEDMARKEELVFLGSLPVDTELVSLLDSGEDKGVLEKYAGTASAGLFKEIVDKML
ncbi:hypothetical protein H0H92_000175 [Tricholoma furcatifolium]|nr:hypothetical protein H0H92_000175 [Tricholoma furcatifolium]